MSYVEQVRNAWAEVLDTPAESIPLDANFFEVGGTSMLLVLLADVLNEDRAEPLSVVDLFQHTTVATLLTRLEKRGVVGQRRDGRQLFYRPLVDEAEVRRSMVADLLGALFGGNAQELVAHLVKESEIAPGDLAKAKRRLARGGQDVE